MTLKFNLKIAATGSPFAPDSIFYVCECSVLERGTQIAGYTLREYH